MGPLFRIVMMLLRRFSGAPGGGLRGAARRIGRGGPRPVPRPAGAARRGGQPMRADRDRDDPPNPWGPGPGGPGAAG